MTSRFPRFLESANSKTPMGKVSGFFPEAHTSTIFCYITARLFKRTGIMMSDCVNSKVLFNRIFPCTVKKIDLLHSDEWFRVGITIAPLLLHLVYFLSLIPKATTSYIMCIRCRVGKNRL